MPSLEIINKIFDSSAIATIADRYSGIVDELQAEDLFYLNLYKENKLKRLASVFARFRKVWFAGLLKRMTLAGYECAYLDSDFWKFRSLSIEETRDRLRHSIVILQNNDFSGATPEDLRNLIHLYQIAEDTLFVVWDTDNHHWLQLSLVLCLVSDIYFPAHLENLAILAKFNQNVMGPVFTGSLQWSTSLLLEHIDAIKNAERPGVINGKHGFYPKFKLRNQFIKTLSLTEAAINFTDGSYRNGTDLQNLLDWCSYKLHFVALVNNDVPYRIFDALITGGIVFVPCSLAIWRDLIPAQENIIYYSYGDVLDFREKIQLGLRRFDEFHGDPQHHQKVLEYIGRLHADNGVRAMIGMLTERLARLAR